MSHPLKAHQRKAIRTQHGVVTVQRRKRRARLTVSMPDGRWSYVDLTDEEAALLAERLDNLSAWLTADARRRQRLRA